MIVARRRGKIAAQYRSYSSYNFLLFLLHIYTCVRRLCHLLPGMHCRTAFGYYWWCQGGKDGKPYLEDIDIVYGSSSCTIVSYSALSMYANGHGGYKKGRQCLFILFIQMKNFAFLNIVLQKAEKFLQSNYLTLMPCYNMLQQNY